MSERNLPNCSSKSFYTKKNSSDIWVPKVYLSGPQIPVYSYFESIRLTQITDLLQFGIPLKISRLVLCPPRHSGTNRQTDGRTVMDGE